MLVDKLTSIIIGRHVDQHIDQISVSILPVWRWTLGQYGDLQMSAEYRWTVGGILINCHIIQWKCCWKIDLTSFLLFWEPLKKPIKIMWSLRNEQFYWNEQTSVRQLSETWLDIGFRLVGCMFTFEQMVWRMGKFLNSRWWVGVFDAFWRVSWWGIRPSKLPTYPGI